ncbi:MAG: hypothetical protein KDA60_19330, partial [Planctomycetales bacterium]|nr:hypothetical protein [Planctomycetales bacterium]
KERIPSEAFRHGLSAFAENSARRSARSVKQRAEGRHISAGPSTGGAADGFETGDRLLTSLV